MSYCEQNECVQMSGNFVVRGDLGIAKIGSLARDVFFPI